MQAIKCEICFILFFNKFSVSAGTRIVLVTWLVIYICLLGVGIYGAQKCPVEKYIPMYLIATGKKLIESVFN